MRHTDAMRRGVSLLVLGVLAVGLGASSAYADGTTNTTTTTAAPSYARLTPSFLSPACVGAGVAAIAEPGQRVLALGTPASALGPSAYPTTAPVVSFASSAASGTTCATASVTLASVSLFGGLVTASSVQSTHGTGTVTGLEVNGAPATLTSGQSMPLGSWGQVTVATTVDRLTAPLVVQLIQRHGSLPAGTTIVVGFAAAAEPVHKSRPTSHSHSHSASGSPGTTQTTKTTPSTGSHARPAHSAKKKHRHAKPHVAQPLKRTPPLGFRPTHYVFPVDGGASYIDTYGANRSDIYDGWHHGDDLFAPLGTPIVAVANGKLSLVGWNRLGGWRVWLTDADGNSFYYAHLAGYSKWVLSHPKVRAGEVIGFLGRTGDAFTTTPHLHFEIHPQQYLSLGYDGAVDPTEYLKKWRIVKVPQDEMPNPARLKAPVGIPAQEAAVVWHELLAARHLLPPRVTGSTAAAKPRRFPHPRSLEAAAGPLRIADIHPAAAHVSVAAAAPDTTVWLGGGLTGAVAIVGLSAGGFFFRRRRRTPGETSS
ncbi:MAG TPA: M23 family metallopeptidase [Gaiellaceae bacterium]|nr:M23 family metallopeptidase [Gaiellaceae bacterium]